MNYADEAWLKMNAEATAKAVADTYSGGVYGVPVNATPYRPQSMQERLDSRADDAAADAFKARRAADILRRHPEFEELMELQRITGGVL